MGDINRYQIIDDVKHPPTDGWVIVESTLIYLKNGDIRKKHILVGECKEDLIWDAQQYTKRVVYDDVNNYFHAETSIQNGYLSPYDPDVVNCDDNDD